MRARAMRLNKMVLLNASIVAGALYGNPHDAPLRMILNPPVWGACPFSCDSCGIPPTHELLCSNISVPLSWDKIEGPRLRIHLSAFRLRNARNRTGSVWFLEGGPGNDGEAALSVTAGWLTSMPNFDVIMPDHRGTGYSSFLDCPGADDVEDGVRQQMACVNQTVKEHGPDYLAHFNPTEAALDLMHAIAAHARLGEEKAFVYSVSYGTYWANRYLQIAPKQPSAVVVDGICSGGLCRIQTYDTNVDMVGGALLDLCDASAECSQNLGGRSARSLAEETFAALDAGTLQCGMRLLRHYNINLTRAVLSKALAIQLMLWQTRVLTVPVIQRLSRCSSDDAA